MRNRLTKLILNAAAAAAFAFTAVPMHAAAVGQDVITVASGTGLAGATVDIPVYIRDTSGTPLGIDQPSGSRIQAYSIKVNYAPASAVQSISFTRAGITAPLTPLAELNPSSPGSVTLIDSFEESTDLIPFTSNKALPGDQVAHLLVQLAPSTTPGTVTLTIDPTLTQLGNQAGTTSETTTLGTLTLVNGTITVLADVPAMSMTWLVLLGLALALGGAYVMRK